MTFVNLFKQRRDIKVNSLPKEIQKKLKDFEEKSSNEYQFSIISPCSKNPMVGDIFVFSPQKNKYFFGRVLEANIESKTSKFFNHKNVIILFNQKTKHLNLDDFSIDYHTMLGNPMIVDNAYWEKGYFHTLGNIPLTHDEEELDYGFYKIHPRGNLFCTASGDLLDSEPRLLGLYAVSTITGVAAEITREFIILSENRV